MQSATMVCTRPEPCQGVCRYAEEHRRRSAVEAPGWALAPLGPQIRGVAQSERLERSMQWPLWPASRSGSIRFSHWTDKGRPDPQWPHGRCRGQAMNFRGAQADSTGGHQFRPRALCHCGTMPSSSRSFRSVPQARRMFLSRGVLYSGAVAPGQNMLGHLRCG
jgi:hypothetical protein